MTAYPDSVYVWTKTSFGAGNEASFNIVIHNNTVSSGASHNAVFQDPAPSNANNSVVGTNATVNNAKIVAQAYKTFYTSNQWVQQKMAFTYPNNNTTPSYILATFSTNKNPGGGSAGHSLYFDDVVLIYNTRLATLKVNGSNLAGFNPDVTSYNYPTPISCSGSAPSVTGTCQSAHASTQIMHNATPAEPYTTIRVKHLNQESTVYKDYTIHFTYQGSTITLNNGGNYTVCQGQPLTMTASGANSYSWSNGLGNSASVSAPTGTAGTTDYTVTGTDASGCTATATATVTVNPLPAVTLTPSATSACTPSTITLTAGGNATSYSWSGVTGSGTSVTLSAANTYNVTVTGTISSTGCSNTASTSVTITQAPTVTISGEASACSQGELTASGATTYSWSNDMGTGATIHPTATGTYTVTGTTNGCSATAQQQFTLRPTPEVSISGGSQFCEGSTLSLMASSSLPGTSFEWSDDNHTQGNTLNVSTTGTYTVTGTLNGCTGTATQTVTAATAPANPQVNNGTRCGAGTVELSVTPVDGYTYNWYTSANTQTVAGTGSTFTTPSLSATTQYWVAALNAAGCSSDRVQVTASVNTPPTVSATPVDPICSGSSVTLSANGADSYTWDHNLGAGNNLTVTPNGTTTYTVTGADANGCTGTATVTVTVNQKPDAPTVNEPEPFCTNGSVSVTLTGTPAAGCTLRWYNSDMTNAGNPNKTLSESATFYAKSYNSATGCESDTTAFHVIVNAVPSAPVLSCAPLCGPGTATLNATVASGLTVKWYNANGQWLADGNTYAANITATTLFHAKAVNAATGCESPMADVTVEVTNVYTINDYQTACGPYTWEGTTYENSGDYTKTLSSVSNCDSIVTLHLTINQPVASTSTATVCSDQLPYTWNGVAFTAAGTQSATLTAANGCDSVVTMTLTVLNATSSSQTLTLCSSQLPYTFLNTTINGAGSYTVHTENAAGCDSTITLTVTVSPTPGLPTIADQSFCGAGSKTLTASAGTNGTVCRWYETEEGGMPIQTGNSYTQNFTEDETYYVSSYNSNTNCESARKLVSVTVNEVPDVPTVSTEGNSRCGAGEVVLSAIYGTNATQCRWYDNATTTSVAATGDSYTVTFNSNQNATRTRYMESYNETTGCKSTRVPAVATEYIVPAAPQVTAATNCGSLTADLSDYVTTTADLIRWYDADETLLAEDAHFNTTVEESTTYKVSSYNGNCESSKMTLTITINPNYPAQSIYDTVCQNTPYQNHGISQTFTTAGEQSFVINQHSANGCDSVVTLYVYVKPQITNTISAEACGEYVWNGETYTTSGVHTQTFTAANGCDSIVTLHLTIKSAQHTDLQISACDAYMWQGVTYTESGDYTETFTASNGCDSTVTLHLTIKSSYHSDIEVESCVNYEWAGTTYSTSGEYVKTFTASNGCDSTVTMHLTIHQPAFVELYDEVCASSLYHNYGFEATYNENGVYELTHNGQTIHGCDSVTVLHLTVKPVFVTELYETICAEGSTLFNGETVNEEGDHTAYLTAANGCDSTVILHLSHYTQKTADYYAEVCAGEAYEGHGFSIANATETMDYQNTAPDVNGCDSITVLHLTVHQPAVTEIPATLCLGGTYNENGFDVTATEVGNFTYTQQLQTVHNCDSTVTLHVTVNPLSTAEYTDQTCENAHYTGYGFDTTFANTGIYTLTKHSENVYGCDSLTTLTLTVYPIYTTEVYDTICFNGEYNFHGQTLTATGDYTTTLASVNHCDSVVNLHLYVRPEKRREISADICYGEAYNDYNFTVEEALETQDYSHVNQDVNGCDSTTVLHLTVHHPAITNIPVTLCYEENYNNYGFSITATESTTYTQNLHTVFGCDSTVNLIVTVNPTHHVMLNGQVCVNEPYTEHGFDTLFAQAGTYTLFHYGENVFGCDSVTELHLTVRPDYHQNISRMICENGSYVFNGQTLTEAGVYTAELQSIYGCDSIVTLNLTVGAEYRDTLEAHVCYGNAYTQYGFNIENATVTGYYEQHTTAVNGCDSTSVLHLIVHELNTTDLYTTLCKGETYRLNGFNVTANKVGDTTYTRVIPTVYGCDSTIVLHVTVNPTSTVVLTDDVCAGIHFQTAGFDTLFTEAGVYTLVNHDLNVYGCDSTTTMTLTVWPNLASTIDTTLCFGESYNFNGTILSVAGTYTDTLKTVHNCDSLVTLHLSIRPENVFEFAETVCVSYLWNETTYTESGDYIQHFTDVNACDSTVTLHLTILPASVGDTTAFACDSFDWYEHTNITESTETLTHTFTNVLGCDSVVTLYLTVGHSNTGDTTAFACNTFDWYEHTNITESTETLTHTFTNASGCDSVVTLHLTVGHSNTGDTTAFACNSFDWYEHTNITESTETLTHTFTNVSGCDSVVTLHLTVGHSNTGDTTAFACDSFDWYEHTAITESTETLTHTFTNVSGCDSVVTLHLTVGHSNTGDTTAFACNTFDWYEHTGITESTETLTHTFTNVSGCDSIVTLHLTVGHSNTGDTTAFACNTFDWYEHTNITESTETLTHTFTNVSGCDSVVTLHLTVGHSNTGDTTAVACDSFDWYEHTNITESTETLTHTFTNVSGCDSVVTLHLTVHYSTAGDTTAVVCETFDWYEHTGITASCNNLTHTFVNAAGCDSVVTLNLTVNYGTHNVTEATECDSFIWNGETYDATGVYTYEYVNADGCASTDTLHLTIHPSFDLTYTGEVCIGTAYTQHGFDTVLTEAGTHTLVHENLSINGCDSTTTLVLTVHPTYNTDTTVDVCDVDLPYLWQDNEYEADGDYTVEYTTVSGCDSILTLHLNVHPTYSQDTAVTVCNGALPYYFDADHSFSAAGSYEIVLQTVNGCDSVWHLQLNVTPNAEHTVTHTICASELPHTFMDSVFAEAGQYDITESDNDNCLTITHFTLIVNPTYHHYDTVTVCEETLPYTYGTTSLTQTGDYDIHFSTDATCDSLVTVHFTVIPTATGAEEQWVCTSNFPVEFGGSTFTEEGVYPVVFHREGLCDSVVTFTLHQAAEYLFPETDATCEHELPYLWRNRELTESGIYYDTLTTQYGCDSVYQLTLTVNPTVVITDNPIVLCAGESESWRGMTLNETGIYRDTVNSVTTGCYEIHEVTVTVNPTYLFHDTVTICSDELPYSWRGMTLTSAGEREDYLQTVHYCDSIYRLTLYVNPSYHLTETVSACDYDLPYLWHGQSLTVSGTYYDTLTTISGCDSTYTLNFTVNASSYVAEADTVCDTELPYAWRGHQLTTTGIYYDTIPNSFGCNDVYELQLTVNQSNAVTINDTICQGGQYTANGFDTLATQPGTIYSQLTLTNANGCDSTVTLVLQVMPTYLTETEAATCENVPYEWRGGEYSVAGDYYDSLTTQYGCDSVFVLHLTLNPTYDIYVEDSTDMGQEYTYDSFVITPTDSGTFHYDIQNYTLVGCDSIVHLTLYVAFVDGIEEFTMTPELTFYPNPTTASLNIRGERMRSVEILDINGRLIYRTDAETPEFTRIDVTPYPTGHYLVKVTFDDGRTATGKIIVSKR